MKIFGCILIGSLLIALYALLGIAIMWLIDELDAFDDFNINIDDYSLAFIFFWPFVLCVVFVFGIKQFIEFVRNIFSIRKE